MSGHDAYLKTALVYWDSVRTIVPESVDAPYSTDTGSALKGAGFLVPLRIRSGMEEIEELAEYVSAYLTTAEGAGLLSADRGGRRHDIHVEKLPYPLGRLAESSSEAALPTRSEAGPRSDRAIEKTGHSHGLTPAPAPAGRTTRP